MSWGTREAFLRWLAVNLALALLPVLLGVLIPQAAHRLRGRKPAWIWLSLGPLLALWLLLLPNTCYLMTTLRHAVVAIDQDNLSLRAADPAAREELTFWIVIAGVNLVIGMLTFVLAIRPVRQLAEEVGFRHLLLAPAFFLVVGLGVYLGLVERLNSWTVVTHPRRVLDALVAILQTPSQAGTVAALGLSLWLLYELLSMAFEGIAMRWLRWAEPPPPEFP